MIRQSLICLLGLAVLSQAIPHKGPVVVKPDPNFKYEGGVHEIPNYDIRLSEEQIKSGIIGENYRWRQGIYFQIDRNFNGGEYDTVYRGLQGLAGATCIQVLLYPSDSNPSGDFIFIQRGGDNTGCWSYVGKQGNRQILNLQWNGCVHYDIVLHEAIHAYGFFHEQSRVDRDSYVAIHWGNIHPENHHNFDRINTEHYGINYDYNSIMHYDSRAFSTNGQPTITAHNNHDVGGRGDVTGYDRQKMARMYGC